MADENPFVSAERYYAECRPGYGESTTRYLVDRFSLDTDARLLDLGCGAGQLASPSPVTRERSSRWTRTRRCSTRRGPLLSTPDATPSDSSTAATLTCEPTLLSASDWRRFA
jgi:hypothetical protein